MNDTFARAKPVPRRAVLRVALTVLMIVVVSLAPELAQDRAAAVSPYRGNLNFVNQTNTTLSIAISYEDQAHCGPGGWVSKGWWTVAPGEITGVLKLKHNDSTHFYYYAFGTDGTTVFDGSYPAYVYNDGRETFFCEPAAGSRPDLDTVDMDEIVVDPQTTTYIFRLGSDRYVPVDGLSDQNGCWTNGDMAGCPAPD